jgi:hypothetical protein
VIVVEVLEVEKLARRMVELRPVDARARIPQA